MTLSEQNVAVAKKPPEAIPGGLAGPGLMAQVIVCKSADHLPLHRLEGIFQRQGVRISRQTMDGWWLATAEFLQPLYALAVRVAVTSHVVHTDDTTVKIRNAQEKREYTVRLALRRRPAAPTDGLRLHGDAPAGWACRLFEGLSRVRAGGCLQRLRRDLLGIPRANHRSGLLGELRGGSMSRVGGWT